MSNPRVRLLFFAALCFWMVFPIAQSSLLAEDAIPFVSAGQIARTDPHDLYVSTPDEKLHPALMRAGCAMAPAGTDCPAFVFPFLGPPQLLPVLAVVAAGGGASGIFLFRLLSVAAFAGGMWALWRRLTPRRPDAELPLLLTAVLLTPYAYFTAAVGQNTPLMFLSGALGISQTNRGRRAAGTAVVLVTTSLFKLFPFALVLVLIWHRKWKLLAWVAGILAGLTAISLVFTPPWLFTDFVDTSRMLTVNRVASAFNISFDSLVHAVDPDWLGTGAAFYAFILVRVALLGGLFWWKLRDTDEDAQWAWVWLAVLVVHPQIWWHYVAGVVPAAAYLLGVGGGWRRWSVPLAALFIFPLTVINDPGQMRIAGQFMLVTATVALPFLARPSRVRAEALEPSKAPLPSSG